MQHAVAESIDLASSVLIVAEIGNNHEGDPATAAKLVRAAASAGVQGVKFQTFRTEHYVSPKDTARFERLKRFELEPVVLAELAAEAHELGLKFLSTPLDLGSVDVLEPLVDAYKVASGDADFYPLLTRIALTRKPVIVSSGVSDLTRVRRALDCIREGWKTVGFDGQIIVLHCVSCYPVEPQSANLNAIRTLADTFGLPVGYSDHMAGIEAAVIAVAAGARVVEKHFTLDKSYSDFRDHQLSADPSEMRELVRRARAVTEMLGDGRKVVMPCERDAVDSIRRSIAASRDLARGHRLQWDDLTWIRPAGRLEPGMEQVVLGRSLRRSVTAGEALESSDFA